MPDENVLDGLPLPPELLPVEEPPRPVRRSTWRTVGVLGVTVAVVVGGLGWVSDATRSLDGGDDGPSFAHLVRRAEGLPEPVSTGLRSPTPGFEEAAGPLASPPRVDDPDPSFEYQLTQPGEGGDEVPVRWSPCRPVHVVVGTAGAPPEFTEAVLEALGVVSAASGLVFTLDGGTTEEPDPSRPPFLPEAYGDRWAPVVIRFADRASVPGLGGSALGITSVHTAVGPSTGTSYLVSGSVYLDTQVLGMPAIGDEPAYVPVLLHELGHVVGLDHVDDAAQLMHPTVGRVDEFQDGDRTGLAELGGGPCAADV